MQYHIQTCDLLFGETLDRKRPELLAHTARGISAYIHTGTGVLGRSFAAIFRHPPQLPFGPEVPWQDIERLVHQLTEQIPLRVE